MKFIITGCDCGGKTTCVEKLKKYFTDFKFEKRKSSQNINDDSWKIKEVGRVNNDNKEKYCNVIWERFPEIDDLVYSNIFKKKKSIFEENEYIFSKTLNELSQHIIIYLYAKDNVLKERLRDRKDKYVKENQIEEILKQYSYYLQLIEEKGGVVYKIDTSSLTPEQTFAEVKKIIEKNKTLYYAPIVKSNCLNLIENYPYQMCLAGIALNNKTYLNFYKKQVEKGHYVIMDNGLYEDNVPSYLDLISLYNYVKPREIIIEDNWNPSKNVEKAEYFINHVLNKLNYDYNTMIIPHGKDNDELLSNLKVLLSKYSHFINCIGIPKKNINSELIKNIELILSSGNGQFDHIRIHILGMHKNLNVVKLSDKIRGFDSSIAYIYSSLKKEITSEFDRGNIEMNWNAKEEIDKKLLKENIENIYEYIN